MFGLYTILPLEFLIPTVTVAKELKWTGHELSHRLHKLEQLDKFQVQAVIAGMYAQKR